MTISCCHWLFSLLFRQVFCLSSFCKSFFHISPSCSNFDCIFVLCPRPHLNQISENPFSRSFSTPLHSLPSASRTCRALPMNFVVGVTNRLIIFWLVRLPNGAAQLSIITIISALHIPYRTSSVAFIKRIEFPPSSLGTAHASAQSLKSIDSWEKKRKRRNKMKIHNTNMFFFSWTKWKIYARRQINFSARKTFFDTFDIGIWRL